MKAVFFSRVAGIACVCTLALASVSSAQTAGNCAEISKDVSDAVSKDPSKVLMVIEDALVINEGCAGDIVTAAIIASKADATLAGQIVQTAVAVAPKMTTVINDAAATAVPGLATVAPAVGVSERPVIVAGKNPVKNPVVTVEAEPDFFVPSAIRGVFLIQPPSSGPLPCSPSTAKP